MSLLSHLLSRFFPFFSGSGGGRVCLSCPVCLCCPVFIRLGPVGCSHFGADSYIIRVIHLHSFIHSVVTCRMFSLLCLLLHNLRSSSSFIHSFVYSFIHSVVT